MNFLWPSALFSLLLLPLFVMLYLRMEKKRRRALEALGPLGIIRDSTGGSPGRRRHIAPVLFLLGLGVLLVGLARPEMAVSLPRVEGTVILAFDVSSSMLAEDLEPTRMEAAKAAARAFVENQPSTIQIGVVAFSNGGFVVQEPTDDQAAILAAIDRLSPQGATSLGQGIFTSLNAIAGESIALDETGRGPDGELVDIGDFSNAVVLMLSDGENTGPPDPLEIAQLAAEAGVRIYPVGIGSPEGAVIEVEGFSILTTLNEAALEEIAALTSGEYFYAEDEETLQDIYENVDLKLTVEPEMMEITSLAAGISLVFFLLGGGLTLAWFGRFP